MASGKGSRKSGFTLTEILISMIILGLIMGAVIGLFFAIVMHFEQSNDITTAQQRGEMVLTALGPKILAAGVGMPATASFDQFSTLSSPSSWDSAVMVSGDTELTVIYAVPAEAVVSGETSLTSSDVSISLTGTMPIAAELKKQPAVAAGWVVFPATGVALMVNDDTPQVSPLVLTPQGTGIVYDHDRLHLVRAARCSIDGANWFVMTDLKPEVTRHVVEGIADIRFDKSTDGKSLTIWVLARGSTRHDNEITGSTLPDWPDEFEPIGPENRHYRLKVVQRTWGLRNR
jgi:prepilin-type N-terminal cleavage/methylation domain-containing protein